jgi:hypothetical protein
MELEKLLNEKQKEKKRKKNTELKIKNDLKGVRSVFLES